MHDAGSRWPHLPPEGKIAVTLTILAMLAALLPGSWQMQAAPIFLPLHITLESISVLVACVIFVLIWESRAHRSHASLLLASAFLATAIFDFFHLLSETGMPDFLTPGCQQKAINFWLLARLIAAVALIGFALRSSKPQKAAAGFGTLQLLTTVLACLLISWLLLTAPDSIPAAFMPEGGATRFKISAQLLIIALNAVAALLLARRYLRQRHPFDAWLSATAWVMGLSEVFFTHTAGTTDLENLLGHLYKIIAFLLAYRALITKIVRQPYDQLAAEASRNRSILDTALDGIQVVDTHGRVVDANPAFASMLGYLPDALRQMHVSDFEVPGCTDRITAAMAKIQAGESAHALIETRLRRQDGSLLDAEIAISLARLPGQDLFVVATRNLADRKMKDSLRLAGEVFLHAHVGLLITDRDGIITELNPMASEITGYARDELLGKTPSLLKSGQHDKDFYGEIWSSLRTRGFWSGEVCNRRKNGELYYELLSITALRHGDQQQGSYLAVFSDITRRRIVEDQMRQIAHFDALTGLPNRLLLADRLAQAIAQNQRVNKLLAVCFMDLDGFKNVNDCLGHEAGDQLLQEVANRLQGMLRGSDTVARLGGDEFVMLISGLATEDECCQAVSRILSRINSPYELGGTVLSEISVSVGVTLYPADASDPDTLLRHADHAMYAAKQAGKNCYQLFDTRMEQRLQARKDTLRRVARGLTAGQFELHYQPKVDCRQRRVIGVEALIRWKHPILGNLRPSEFLPLLEDDDLALTLGEWVFREALRQGRIWQEQGRGLAISVNAFSRQLQRPNFAQVVAQAIHDVWPDLPSGKFIIEITEGTALMELERAQKTTRECRALGVGFSLDDFGTGYSSMTYLRQLTVDELKIDQSFVRDMLTDSEDLSIIVGLIGLGRAFSLEVVAEGVETQEQIDFLLGLGCDLMQGYGIARPMPAAQFEAWLQQFSEPIGSNK